MKSTDKWQEVISSRLGLSPLSRDCPPSTGSSLFMFWNEKIAQHKLQLHVIGLCTLAVILLFAALWPLHVLTCLLKFAADTSSQLLFVWNYYLLSRTKFSYCRVNLQLLLALFLHIWYPLASPQAGYIITQCPAVHKYILFTHTFGCLQSHLSTKQATVQIPTKSE